MCMNPGQVKNLIGEAKGKQANAGALRGLIDIMKGETLHPYPPKCHNAYEPFDEGVNRPVARVYFALDEVCPPASRPRLLTAPVCSLPLDLAGSSQAPTASSTPRILLLPPIGRTGRSEPLEHWERDREAAVRYARAPAQEARRGPCTADLERPRITRSTRWVTRGGRGAIFIIFAWVTRGGRGAIFMFVAALPSAHLSRLRRRGRARWCPRTRRPHARPRERRAALQDRAHWHSLSGELAWQKCPLWLGLGLP